MRDRDRADDGRAARARATRRPDADLVELRLDTVGDPDVAGALAGRRRPVIVTCRPAGKAGTSADRRRSAGGCCATRWRSAPSTWTSNGAPASTTRWSRATAAARIVLSSHDFDGVPADLAERARAMRATGAEVVKIAVTARGLSDCVPLLELARSRRGRRQVRASAWATPGSSRACCPARFGSAWTYAGRRVGAGTDPGGAAAATSSASARSRPRPRSTASSARPVGAFGVAGDAQRGVPRRAARRRLPAAAGARRRRLPDVRRRASASAAPASRSRSRSTLLRARRRGLTRSRAASARSTRSASTTAAGSGGNTDVAGFLAAAARAASALDGLARRGPRRRRRGARGRRRAAPRAARASRVHARDAASRRQTSRRWRAVDVGAVAAGAAAAGTCWSTARRSACIPTSTRRR